MSDYTPSGDPTDGTTADATELSAEFILIQTAVNSKADETNAVLVTPNIGTPSAGTLTNCTGLPISTGVSGLGSGIATFLATPSSANLATAVTGETGSGALVFATSPTLTTPDIGTPSAGVLTNCTGTAAGLTAGNATTAAAVAVGGITGLGSGVATWLTTPSSTNLAAAVTDETGSGALVFGTSPTINSKTVFSPTAGTAQASTSGTSIDFTGIPAGVTRVTVVFSAVSTNGTTNIIVQIGDSGGIETSSYTSTGFTLGASPSSVSQTNGFLVRSSPTDGSSTNGRCVIENIDGTTWTGCCVSGNVVTHGAKALSGVLDRVRVTTSVGADAFDAGTINIIYE